MTAFWKNTLIRIAATAVVVGLPPLAFIWSNGSFGVAGDYVAAGAFALGGVASLIVSIASRFIGDSDSGSFVK
jgi:hypothetical protein